MPSAPRIDTTLPAELRSDAFARVSAHVESLIGVRAGAAVIALRG